MQRVPLSELVPGSRARLVFIYVGSLVPAALLCVLAVVAASAWLPQAFGWTELSTNALRLIGLLAFFVAYLAVVQALRRSVFASRSEDKRPGATAP